MRSRRPRAMSARETDAARPPCLDLVLTINSRDRRRNMILTRGLAVPLSRACEQRPRRTGVLRQARKQRASSASTRIMRSMMSTVVTSSQNLRPQPRELADGHADVGFLPLAVVGDLAFDRQRTRVADVFEGPQVVF